MSQSNPHAWDRKRPLERKVTKARRRGESSIDFTAKGYSCALSWAGDTYALDIEGETSTGTFDEVADVVRLVGRRPRRTVGGDAA